MGEHVLFINSNVVSKDDETLIGPYPRGNAEELGTSNDVDLWADPDVDINTVIAADTPYIATFTENQLAHHKYDWDKGVLYQDVEGHIYSSTPGSYGVLRYECVDVCADYKDNAEEHPYSFECDGTYVYAPLVAITYNANTDDEVTGMPVTECDQIEIDSYR